MTSTIAPTDNPVNSDTVTLDRRASLPGRTFGVVTEPQTYRNLGYLLLGLPMGTLWFTLLVTGAAIGISTLVLALLGIPVLIGCWYMTRSIANIERVTANTLLGQRLAPVPAGVSSGNPWARLRTMSADHARWRELGYVLLRFPVGIATFTSAVALLTTSASLMYAPFYARYDDDHSFGDWSMSSRLEDISTSPWAWLLVPFGALLLVGSLHLMNLLADACGRWTTASLGTVEATAEFASPTSASASVPWTEVGSWSSALLRIHLLTFTAVMALLALIDVAGGGGIWFHWPLITWGPLVGLHASLARSAVLDRSSTSIRILRIHQIVFAAVIVMLSLVDLAGGGGIWFFWPLLTWGAVVALHTAVVRRRR